MSKITCDICMDLIPLVKDGVASSDSKQVVLEHLEECDDCRAYFELCTQNVTINDKKVFGKIKKQIHLAILILTVSSILFGVSLTMSENMFYNVIIMPVIGAVGYSILKKKAYMVPLFVFVISFVWHFIICFGEIGFHYFLGQLIAPLYWALIYCGLCSLGTVVAFLLHFAFKKETNQHEEVS